MAELLEGGGEREALDSLESKAERRGDRRSHVTTANHGQLHPATDRRTRRDEERVVIRIDRALTVIAEVLRRAVLLFAGGAVAEGVAGSRLEHRVGDERVVRRRRESQ